MHENCGTRSSKVLFATVALEVALCDDVYVDTLCANVDVTFTRDGLNYIRNFARAPAGHAHTRVLVAMHARADFKKQRNSVRSFRCVAIGIS